VNEEQVLNQILEDEGLTSDLDEAEATRLTNALLAQAKLLLQQTASPDAVASQVKALRQRGRQIAKVVATFRDDGPEPARQRAQQAQLPWPTSAPTSALQLLEHLLTTVTTTREGA
jgi:hypothetical protein